MSLLRHLPLLGPFWSFVLQSHRLGLVLGGLSLCTAVLLFILWVRSDTLYLPRDPANRDPFVYIRRPFCGFSPNQIRAGLTLALPLTFHLAPLILALMILYHLGRGARHLGRVLTGSETDL